LNYPSSILLFLSFVSWIIIYPYDIDDDTNKEPNGDAGFAITIVAYLISFGAFSVQYYLTKKAGNNATPAPQTTPS